MNSFRDTSAGPRGSSNRAIPGDAMRIRSRRDAGHRIVASFAMLAFAMAALAACANSNAAMSPGTHLAFGEWGGDHVDVVASQTQTNVLLGCMSGVFSGNIPLDANGRFIANGTWNLSIGPIRLDGNMPAQLSGQVSGRTVTIAVAVYDTVTKQVTSLGPQSAEFGKPSVGQVCPV